jgi:hypothetical protein
LKIETTRIYRAKNGMTGESEKAERAREREEGDQAIQFKS